MANEEKPGWTLSDNQKKLLDLARRLKSNLRITTDGPAAGGSRATSAASPKARSTTGRPGSSGTSATATAPKPDATTPPPSTTSATSTLPTSTAFTDWTVSPSGFVENGLASSIVTLSGLPDRVQSSIRELATGTGEPVGAVIQQICEFFVDAESEWAEAPLSDALAFYTENYLL